MVVLTRFILVRLQRSGGILWMRQWKFVFYKMQRIYWVAQRLCLSRTPLHKLLNRLERNTKAVSPTTVLLNNTEYAHRTPIAGYTKRGCCKVILAANVHPCQHNSCKRPRISSPFFVCVPSALVSCEKLRNRFLKVQNKEYYRYMLTSHLQVRSIHHQPTYSYHYPVHQNTSK